MNHVKGNLLNVERGILVHQVNTLGVMGAGIALQIRQKWPRVFEWYASLCEKGKLKLGDVMFIEVGDNLVVANLAGQSTLGGIATDYASYETALPKIASYAAEHDLPIYFPKGIGCGLAGGDWFVMLPILERHCPNSTIVEFSQPEDSTTSE